MDFEFPHLQRFLSYRIGLLRSLRRWLGSWGFGYVVFDGNHDHFWKAARKHIPSFSPPLTIAEIDEIQRYSKAWRELRAKILLGDKIYPFAMNVDTLAMRLGYVVLRDDKLVGGVVTVGS